MPLSTLTALSFLESYIYPACVFVQPDDYLPEDLKPHWCNAAYENDLNELALHWESSLQRLLMSALANYRSGSSSRRSNKDNYSMPSRNWIVTATVVHDNIIITTAPRGDADESHFEQPAEVQAFSPPQLTPHLQLSASIDPGTVSHWSKTKMGSLVLQYPWESTFLGPISSWSSAFKATVTLILDWPERMCLWLGDQSLGLFNDRYLEALGPRKLTQALGARFQDIYPEFWDHLKPYCHRALRGEQLYFQDHLLLMDRDRPGADESAWGLEETYHTWSFTPLNIEGVVGFVNESYETTSRVVAERQMNTFRNLGVGTSAAVTPETFYSRSLDALSKNALDFPFVIMYTVHAVPQPVSQPRFRLRLHGKTGAPDDHEFVPPYVDVRLVQSGTNSEETLSTEGATPPETHIWPFQECLSTHGPVLVPALGPEATRLHKRSWDQQCRSAILFPVAVEDDCRLVVILGLNPCRPFDDEYRGFVQLLQSYMTASLTTVLNFETTAKKAEELASLDRAKTVFFGNVSHELRTPLTLIVAPLEDIMADQTMSLTAIRAQNKLVLRHARRLHQLVNSLLDFARLEAGRLLATFRPVDIGTVTADLASLFRSAIERGGVEYVVRCKTGTEVFVDLDAWEKIVTNIISNAFKYCLQGKIEVSVEYSKTHMLFSCSDTGCGIPESDISSVFERFHRVENRGGRSIEGTGVGLALTYETVKVLGGTIDVQSEVDVGSTFTVSLPLGTAHIPADRIPYTSTNPGQHSSEPSKNTMTYCMRMAEEARSWLPSDGSGSDDSQSRASTNLTHESSASASDAHTSGGSWFLTSDEERDAIISNSVIVVADDNADLRHYCTNLLAGMYRVHGFPDGEAAWEFISENPVDLVLTDVQMPRMGGFELLRHVRSHQTTTLLPVILLSAAAEVESRAEGLTAGADDYLVKPFSSKELLARVKSQLIRGGMRVELEARVQDRTRLLVESENRLLQQISESEHMRKQQEIVVDLTSHELRNPLNAIWQNAELIEEILVRLRTRFGKEGANLLNDADEAIRSIVLSVAHQTRIADDILNFSKISMSLLTIHRAPFPLVDTVQDVLRWWELETRERDINLDVTAPPELRNRWVVTDSQRLSQVLINFLTNAIRFTSDAPTRHITVFLETADHLRPTRPGLYRVGSAGDEPVNTENGAWLTVGVKDSGSGLSPDERAKLFERFAQAHPSKDQFSGGHGLGLFVSRHITLLLGGVIDVESVKGQGSTFSFVIPIEYAEPQTAHNHGTGWRGRGTGGMTASDRSHAKTSNSGAKHILIVEDNIINQKVLMRQLQSRGYRTSVAGDGQEALNRIITENYDLVLMDIEMPVKDGKTACREYREVETSRGTPHRLPLIAVTGNAREEQVQECLDAGFDHVAIKPYQIKDLVLTIEQLLESGQA